jgi:hypothetical protein
MSFNSKMQMHRVKKIIVNSDDWYEGTEWVTVTFVSDDGKFEAVAFPPHGTSAADIEMVNRNERMNNEEADERKIA